MDIEPTDEQTAVTKCDIEAANDILEHADQDDIEKTAVVGTKKRSRR